MRYEYIRAADDEFDAEDFGEQCRVVGVTLGCGCCSRREEVTAEELDTHIRQLEKILAEAKKLRELFD
jgi:hypothetical protein